MLFTARSAGDVPAALDADTSDIAVHVGVPDRNIRRSTMNVAAWSSYLPIDCVKKMINMGWDKTT